ncbi:MAG: replication initiator protein [Microviridae sp.]|nr:MAG: replication initiator protein [Microviridae sp.]
MPCFHPVKCWRYTLPCGPNLNRPIVHAQDFEHAMSKRQYPVPLAETVRPCSQCVGCRLEKARQTAMRCVHEASLHSQNCFLTLTYCEGSLPSDRSITYEHMRDFWKRFRDRFDYPKIKYYSAGEYGTKFFRPHYHACLFGFDFPDKFYYKTSEAGSKLYASPLLDEIWGKGNCDIGDVTFESAAYVARYTLSKRYGNDADNYYSRLGVRPEDSWCSQGLGKEWFERYSGDCYPKDWVTLRGMKMRPPKYYDNLLLKYDPELLADLKASREAVGKLNKSGINFDIRHEFEYVSRTCPVDGVTREGYVPVRKAVSELVLDASLRSGRVDFER